ncbi:MAG: peptide ABC transporter substrate-binding protein [Bacillota bacterium]|uniref:peptide ABC transporter substrate-binding protein n=1 Tax=unclassified Virgibacillus TaxID=2620237 RepID=UPI000EF4A371|nr:MULTISPECIES: peptide ABC transporter substrate-binding protein [unclassified Virgibacillus]MCC2248501.1 peptide ABC transporter substrate-binding protein [Virgibacillus sp. AGTR]MDY7043064.1 peptide ABC transporter substrate-binding protein [Virgibacillus sp. M23]QRZ16636.1 peptide ABC transporter substrate-binding protein [Virgibacillus sp. AGTR]
MRLRSWILFLVFGLLISVIVACSGESEDASTSEGETDEATADTNEEKEGEKVLSFINPEAIPSMDPSLATDESSFIYLAATTEGLYRLDENAQPVEGIATDHEVSDDGLTWTFTLREDTVWENGDPVTAHDFVYSWQRAVNPETGSEYGPYMMNGVIKNATAISSGDKPIEELGVKADGDYTLVVELENPTAYFESLTTFGTFLPLNQKFVEEQGDNFATSSDTLLANGPYKIANWKSTSSSWELEKNEDYWDADTVKMDKINFEVVKDPQTSVDLYESGKIDRVDLTSDLVDQYSTNDDYVITPDTFVYFIKFNQTTTDATANVNIRKAISKAFNKQALVDEILNNGSIVANGLVPADFTPMPETGEDFREVNGDLVTYDIEEAKKLWEKGLEEIGKDSVELELLTDDDETTKLMVEYIANQLSTNLPGLNVTLKQVPKEQRLDLDTSMNYEIQVSRWGPDFLDPFTYMNLWTTDSGNNMMGYSNEEYDNLVNATTSSLATDNVARYENFLEAEKILFEDAAIAPIYQASRAQLVSPKVKGVFVNPFGATYEYKWADVGSAE